MISLGFASYGTATCKSAGGSFVCCAAANASIMAVGYALTWSAGLIGLAALGVEVGGVVALSAGTAVSGVIADITLMYAPISCKAK